MASDTPRRDMPAILTELKASGAGAAYVDDGWLQGRAAYGGLVAALAVAGLEKALAGDVQIRSLMTNFVAPLPAGEAKVETRVLREGRSVTQMVADVKSGDQVAAHVSAAYGAPRETRSFNEAVRTDLPPKNGLPASEDAKRMLPAFLSHFDVEWLEGGIPLSNKPDTYLRKWVRHRSDMGAFPAAKLVAVADVPPPIMMAHYNRIVMGSSLSWSLEFLCDPKEVTSEWFYLDFTLDSAGEGYTRQSGKIYDETGKLIMLTRQCMVYFE